MRGTSRTDQSYVKLVNLLLYVLVVRLDGKITKYGGTLISYRRVSNEIYSARHTGSISRLRIGQLDRSAPIPMRLGPFDAPRFFGVRAVTRPTYGSHGIALSNSTVFFGLILITPHPGRRGPTLDETQRHLGVPVC